MTTDQPGFRHVGDEHMHQGWVWRVVRADFLDPDGGSFQRDIVRSPGAVGVVPLIDDDAGRRVVLVRQYRAPYDELLIEIPAGLRDVPGEPADETGRRELIEEAGLAAGTMTHLVDVYPSPGMTDSITVIYLATDCTPAAQDLHGPEEQHMEVMEVELDEALAMIDRREITDGKTVAGLLMTDRLLRASSTLD